MGNEVRGQNDEGQEVEAMKALERILAFTLREMGKPLQDLSRERDGLTCVLKGPLPALTVGARVEAQTSVRGS